MQGYLLLDPLRDDVYKWEKETILLGASFVCRCEGLASVFDGRFNDLAISNEEPPMSSCNKGSVAVIHSSRFVICVSTPST